MTEAGKLKPGSLYVVEAQTWLLYPFLSDEDAIRFWCSPATAEPPAGRVRIHPDEKLLMINYVWDVGGWFVAKFLYRDELCYFPDAHLAPAMAELCT